MGGTNSIISLESVNQTIIDLNEYKCSNKGLILPCKLNDRIVIKEGD